MTKEDIKIDYEKFIINSDFINNKDDFICYVDSGINELYENIDIIQNEIKKNKYMIFTGKVYNSLIAIFTGSVEMVDFYKDDNELLESELTFCEKCLDYYFYLRDNVCDNNYLEFTKFIDFCTKYFNSNLSYLEQQRISLDCSYREFSFIPKGEDTRLVFDEFFMEVINV